MALQHLRSSTANKRPDPTAMAAGQLALNNEATSPGLFFKDSGGNLVKVGPVHVGTTAPNATPASGGTAGNSVGEQWLDTSGSSYVFKVWDGTAWRSEAGEFVNASGDTMTGALVMDNQQQVRFRETTANGTNYIAIQAPASVATDKTLTLPDATGTLISTGDTGTVTSTMIADGTIVNGDINASAAIAGTKISPDFGSQNTTTTGTSTAASFIPTSSTAPTNGVYLPAANSVAISTNGSGRLFVNSSGSVGIGTSSPATILNTFGTSSQEIRMSTNTAGDARLGFDLQGAFYNWIESYRASGRMSFATGNTVAMSIDSSQRVGIGTTSPSAIFHTKITTDRNLLFNTNLSGEARITAVNDAGNANVNFALQGDNVILQTGGGAARVDSSGRLLVGTSSSVGFGCSLQVVNSSGINTEIIRNSADGGGPTCALGKSRGSASSPAAVSSGDNLGTINFRGFDGTNYIESAFIQAAVDATPGTNDMPGRLVFSTTADGASSPTERMRISQNGRIAFGGQGAPYSSATCDTYNNVSGEFAHAFRQDNATGFGIGVGIDGTYLAYFYPNKDLSGAPVGSISQNGTATAYNTSSDYRLKENINAVTDGIARLQQLKPSRFNFIADPYKTVDGFIAHEVQAVVPEAINGEKDAVDDNGNPIYQGIDQSKLVPLLTAALQEAIAKIETLEAKVAALEAA